jgi:hypothetical protein
MVWLVSKPGMRRYVDSEAPFTMLATAILITSVLVYAIAGLGMLALMLASLRALPAGTYIFH